MPKLNLVNPNERECDRIVHTAMAIERKAKEYAHKSDEQLAKGKELNDSWFPWDGMKAGEYLRRSLANKLLVTLFLSKSNLLYGVNVAKCIGRDFGERGHLYQDVLDAQTMGEDYLFDAISIYNNCTTLDCDLAEARSLYDDGVRYLEMAQRNLQEYIGPLFSHR